MYIIYISLHKTIYIYVFVATYGTFRQVLAQQAAAFWSGGRPMWCPSRGYGTAQVVTTLETYMAHCLECSFPFFHSHTCSDIKSSTTFQRISKLEKFLRVECSVCIREGSSAGLEQDGTLAIHVTVELVAANLLGNLSVFRWEFIEMTREGAASLSTKKKVPHRLCIFPSR